MEEVKKEKKRQPYISYLKGFAIVAVMLIHLIDWSGIGLGNVEIISYFKELLFPGVMFFVSMIGALMYFAYKDSDLKRSTFKLVSRGLQVIGVYYVYSIVKFFVYDFRAQDYFGYFYGWDKMEAFIKLISLKVSDVPLPILVTLGIFMVISPLFLFIIKKVKYPKIIISLMLVAVIVLNYFVQLPSNVFTNIIYSKGYVFFPIMLWMIPYLVGILVSMIGLDEKKKIMLPFSFFMTVGIGILYYLNDMSFLPSHSMYPLNLYYVVFSLFIMYLLIYFFGWVEKQKNKFSEKFLAVTTFLGDNTLDIFILHWIIIDLSYWIFRPYWWSILITVPFGVILFTLIKMRTKSKIILDKQK